jgi:DNA-binding transcriptional regulator LsrR (DeoR family)
LEGEFRVTDAGLSPQQRRLDLAARAAWLYYVRGRTQDEIALELNVSRQNAQRLVALAGTEGLVKFRLDHHLSDCIVLAQRLQDRFGLRYCEVAPGSNDESDNRVSLAVCAGRWIETMMLQKVPQVLGFGTGRTLREAVRQVPSMDQPQHKIVSLVGNIGPDGRASPYDVVMRLADRVGAQCYPLPMPIVADTPAEREMLQSQRGYRSIREMAAGARAWLIGIGDIGWEAPLHVDGFISDEELGTLIERGAIGEVLGWAFDAEGRLVRTGLHDRLTAVALDVPVPEKRLVITVGAGRSKVGPIVGAMQGGLVNGLITDEPTARAVLGEDEPE